MKTKPSVTALPGWPDFCPEREGGCAASLTETDQMAGYCTNCGRELEPQLTNEEENESCQLEA